MFDSPASPHLANAQYFASNTSLTRLTGYDRYLAGGPQSQSDIELSKMDSIQEPLLNPQSHDYFQHQQALASQRSFSPSIPPSVHQDYPLVSGREAPTHRPQERSYSPYGSENSPAYSPEPQYHTVRTASPQQRYPSPYPHHPRQDSTSNLGRGAYGR
jgi:calcium permeable stress-gated cation channel